LPIV